MSIPINRKFKISLHPESAKGQSDGNGGKTQGLKTGDIVRRQYFDGKNVIYSLMGVLDYGVDEVQAEEAVLDSNGNYILLSQDPLVYKKQSVIKQQPWFIGVLLDGDSPKQGEVLDFVRITSLFDETRSGALYLTASDDESPFMDVIDGIGRNFSLTWPENINNGAYNDPQCQYIVEANQCLVEYIDHDNDRRRICHIRKNIEGDAFIRQSFTQYVQNPNQVLISFWAKATTARTIKLNLAYTDESRVDGEIDVRVGTDWSYHLYRITVDYSGRHRRAINLNLSALLAGEDFYISDFNAILLSSIANFGDASQIRIGKLTGVSDPIFGKLDSYGGYFQKLFATTSAHISGTLTAGDENGFAATFYAGKIHKNAFLNSISPEADVVGISDGDLIAKYEIQNPTGMGKVFEVSKSISVKAQLRSWLHQKDNDRVDKLYTFSFWAYCMCGCQLMVLQNARIIGTINILHSEILSWQRQKVTFKLLDTENNEDVIFSVVPIYTPLTGNSIDSSEKRAVLFTAPQLESGETVTQYQPTDEVVTHLCEDYGAWFSRGGIGGTIQNPLLQLNMVDIDENGVEHQGSIGTKSKSFVLRLDGSGYLANHGIVWDENGNVTFGPNVRLNWDNLGPDVQHHIEDKNIKIIGNNTFIVMVNDDMTKNFSPNYIELQLEKIGIEQGQFDCQWYSISEIGEIEINTGLNEDKSILKIFPDEGYWANSNTLTIKAVVNYLGKKYVDSFTVSKISMDGYSVIIKSSKGEMFRNGNIETVLTAEVLYQGQPVPDEILFKKFTLTWKKYLLPNMDDEIQNWWMINDLSTHNTTRVCDRHDKTLVVSDASDGSVMYVCEITSREPQSFVYDFPIIF